MKQEEDDISTIRSEEGASEHRTDPPPAIAKPTPKTPSPSIEAPPGACPCRCTERDRRQVLIEACKSLTSLAGCDDLEYDLIFLMQRLYRPLERRVKLWEAKDKQSSKTLLASTQARASSKEFLSPGPCRCTTQVVIEACRHLTVLVECNDLEWDLLFAMQGLYRPLQHRVRIWDVEYIEDSKFLEALAKAEGIDDTGVEGVFVAKKS
ncbi:hypothetical protein BDP27DRAFT_1371238 [Rhodocollybia butyracea]|uniref:Uncharacterized protein n=1 Tax=Rhodocollybia butyracea TaxID=206335 RepID=A0A9P5P7G3_9AGAR|nr:hypothetical protein BDP27DRAFT_1371238 [Rhodocollybia butyracea]